MEPPNVVIGSNVSNPMPVTELPHIALDNDVSNRGVPTGESALEVSINMIVTHLFRLPTPLLLFRRRHPLRSCLMLFLVATP